MEPVTHSPLEISLLKINGGAVGETLLMELSSDQPPVNYFLVKRNLRLDRIAF